MSGLGRIYSRAEILERAIPVLQKYAVKSATLFGSYAKGAMNEQSDIDLVIDTDRRGFLFGDILADLFDIFGYGNVDLYAWYEFDEAERMFREIKKTGVEIYNVEQERPAGA